MTEKGQALRKVETALPHPLARDEDHEVIRRQVDIQHEAVLLRIEDLVLDGMRRRVLWSDQSRSVDPDLLAWAVSALAQLVETEVGTEETTRVLLATHERSTVLEDVLRVFHVTPTGACWSTLAGARSCLGARSPPWPAGASRWRSRACRSTRRPHSSRYATPPTGAAASWSGSGSMGGCAAGEAMSKQRPEQGVLRLASERGSRKEGP